MVRHPDGYVEEWVGCGIAADGKLVAGKIEKNIVRLTNGKVLEWVGCEIDDDGELVAGKNRKES